MATMKALKSPTGSSHWEVLGVQEILNLLDRMVEQPSISNIINLLQKCRKEKSLEYAKHVHSHICNNGLEGHAHLGNFLVPMFVECGSVSDAQQAFNSLSCPNEYSWTSLISGHAETGQVDHAFNLYQEMQKGTIDPSGHTLAALLRACSQVTDVEKGQQIHVDIRNKGFEKDIFVGSMLVDMYVKCGHLREAQESFDELPVKNVVTWTTLIGGYAEHGSGQEALKFFEQMQLEGVSPNAVTFVCSLKACSSIGAIDKGRHLHSVIVKERLESDLFIGNTLVDMYAKRGSFSEAQKVFDKMPVRNVVSWNSLIAGYAENGLGQESLKCFEQMQVDGMSPNVVTFVCSLKACGSTRDLDKGRAIHTKVAQMGLEKDLFIGTGLVDMYAKCGSLQEAREVFDKIPAQDVVLWNAIIAGYAENGFGFEAMQCFDRMQLQSLSPDAVTFSCILKACGLVQAISKGRELHTRIVHAGFEQGKYVGDALVSMYAKCGSLPEAQEVFNRLGVHHVVSWNILIALLVENEFCLEALECFRQMQIGGVPPDNVTFVCSLKACGSMGGSDRGSVIHATILQKELERDLFIGNGLIQMYVRCGAIAEACDVFDRLPVRDVMSWTSLLAGIAEHGSRQELQGCFEQMGLEGMFPDIATFLCCLKACCSIGNLDNGREIHAQITKKDLETDVRIGTTLISMYAKHGLLVEAQNAFDKLSIPDVVSWNALMAAYIENGYGHETMKRFELMQLNGVAPDAAAYVCGLKACGSIGALTRAQEIHAEIVEKGFEKEPCVVNALVATYAKCRALAQAQEAFEKLPFPDVTSWTALITAFSESGFSQEAFNCLEAMQLRGVYPDVVMFVCLLKACGSIGDLDKGREIHTMIRERGFEGDLRVSSALVGMYSKCGSLAGARELFDNLPVRDVMVWTTMIGGYAERGSGLEALKCFEEMQLNAMYPDAVTFAYVLQACGNIEYIAKGQEMHAEVIQKGYKDLFIGTTLIKMYAKCGLLAAAQETFDKLPTQDVISWNALVEGYVENECDLEALTLVGHMKLRGISPSSETFVYSLKSCARLGALDMGREMHREIVDKGYENDLFVANTLLFMYAKCGALAEARQIFHKLSVRDAIAWTTLIGGYVENGLGHDAVKCFEEMQTAGVFPDAVTFVWGLKACGSTKSLDKGREMHKMIAEKGFGEDPFVANALVDMYSKCGVLVEAQKIFDQLAVRDVVSWTALISGYAENNLGEEALKRFELMQKDGISPNSLTYVACLIACGCMGALDKGREIHNELKEKELERDAFVGNTLVDMYCKCGSLPEAQSLFEKLNDRNIVSWTAMIKGYSMNDDVNKAVKCFEDMQKQGVKPDAVTFTCLLTACSRAGMVDKGQEYFNLMKQYGIVITEDHCNCMVDLLARSGQLHDAERFLKSAPCPPSKEAWTSLLGACKKYGELELGLRCFQQLIKISPGNASSYGLMGNLFSSTGGLDSAHKIEQLRKFAGAKKKPAKAIIEVNKKIHQFTVGEKRSDEVAAKIEELTARLKEEGYVPNIDLVLKPISNKEKELSLCGHAEKAAIAFGLLHTPQGHTLRMSKNLRMCNDCHNATKIISRIEKREIILRETNFIHRFKDGLCACGDMW